MPHSDIVDSRYNTLRTNLERQLRILKRKEAIFENFCTLHHIDPLTGTPLTKKSVTRPKQAGLLFDKTSSAVPRKKLSGPALAVGVSTYLINTCSATTGSSSMAEVLTEVRRSQKAYDRFYMPLCTSNHED